MSSWPRINPKVKHVGVSKLREMNADFLAQMNRERLTYVLQHGDEPIAVLVSYEEYLALQDLADECERKMTLLVVKDGSIDY